ncbi:MAG: VOC family protein [Magnetovibrio sp.]|nr:VOC family protein [Magnetovibrio sp.]
MNKCIHFITLGVSDMKASRIYYEALGWVASPMSQDDATFFQSGGQVLGLYRQDSLNQDTGLKDPKPGGLTLGVNLHSRKEVDDLYEQALKAGATVLKRPQATPWGGYVGYVADLDGHPWEFTYVAQLVPDESGVLTLP